MTTEDLSSDVASPAVGRIGCPPGQEANVDEFYFWVAPGSLVEQTQIVRVETALPLPPDDHVTVYGVVEQVYRRSAISSMHMEVAAYDGDPVVDDLPLENNGVTYAKARVINTFPEVFTPPIEGSTVFSCAGQEAEIAYEMDAYAASRGVCIGLIRNGGRTTAGRAFLDQDFLLGAQAGHLNVNGAAGSGTKSSFLTIATSQTIDAVKARAVGMVGTGKRPSIKAIIFNVKGFDLFFLDRWSTKFTDEDASIWSEMGASPSVFKSIAYYAAERPERTGEPVPVSTPRPGDVRAFSWSLKDIIDLGLFELLFSDESRANENLMTLINYFSHRLSETRTRMRGKERSLYESQGVEPSASRTGEETRDARRQLTESLEYAFNTSNEMGIRTFQGLLDYVQSKAQPEDGDLSEETLQSMSRSTIQALWRRLLRVLNGRSGLLRRDDVEGSPLALATAGEDVHVIDLQSIGDQHLQRFVIAAVLRQLVDWRSGPNADANETFLVVIDELNRYAPRGASDAITSLFEYVASQMRSRGIILFGAQQQGSRASEVVIENSQTRVLGRSGGQELADAIWRGFSEGDRKLALRLAANEKVIVAPNFREALHIKVPRPPWAMRPEEASTEPPDFLRTAASDQPRLLQPTRDALDNAAAFEP
jgi:DNA helicase HerA-like ATPase